MDYRIDNKVLYQTKGENVMKILKKEKFHFVTGGISKKDEDAIVDMSGRVGRGLGGALGGTIYRWCWWWVHWFRSRKSSYGSGCQRYD
ncbi:hypothetical protein A1D29_00785 [Pasteurellaceae bacterium Orientalotternb1]|nr:hypothetical protein A1D29_00785 [Pasteurellaceae bacterium Orientalotternb1]